VFFGCDLGVFFGFGQGWLSFGYYRPVLGQLGVELDKLSLIIRHVFFGIDGVDWALGYADRAIDALIRIYHQEVRSYLEAVHRTHIHTVGIAAFDA
jgi:hypothetical protein